MKVLIEEFNKAVKYLDAGKAEKALPLLKKVLKEGEFKEAWLNLGCAYKALNDYASVRKCFQKAADVSMPMSNLTYPKVYALAEGNLGLWNYTFEQDDVAIAHYHKILAEEPENAETKWNLSIAQLRKYCSGKDQNLAEAWSNYNNRFYRLKPDAFQNDKEGLFLWDCVTEHPDKRLVVMNEQGNGDILMFARYLEYAEKYFKEIYIHCTPEMATLFNNKYKTFQRTSLTDAEFGIPMASLARLLDHIPNGEWLADRRKPKAHEGLNILCVWGGSAAHINNKNRSTHAGYFDSLKQYGTLYSLEKRKGYKEFPIVDWATSVEQLNEIDLVVSVDTSIVHLCGSLGMPCLVLMPLLDCDFRWGDSSMGEKNLWYSSVKVIRNPNSWEAVFKRVKEKVHEFMAEYNSHNGITTLDYAKYLTFIGGLIGTDG